MATMNISLPDAMKAFVEQEAEKGGFVSVSEYLRSLIRETQSRQAKRDVDEKLREGLASGPAEPMARDDWDDLERRVHLRQERGGEGS